MPSLNMRPTILAAAVALLCANSGTVSAWAPSPSRSGFVARTSSVMRMAGDDKEDVDKFQMTSARKEVVFDDEAGRFFETNREAEECIPDEEYCRIDDDGSPIRLTIAEKERIFLDSLQSYYITGRQLLKDDDFDKLKEDLQWNGSPVVVLNRQEATYLAAVEAYLKGEPTMDDKEFDALKKQLKEEGSQFAVDTEPKCYIDSGVCKVTLQEDKFRSNLLYLPAGAFLTIVWLGLGFEFIEPIVRLNPLVLAALGSPLIYNGSKTITEDFLFQEKFIAYGPCPTCEFENRVYFGNILGVEGFSDEAKFKCKKCKSEITVQKQTLRASTLPKV
mmetsp:Transcript_12120/g.33365  ORF Transcript_12120/g.33365 Transcript_12120/m.33365 type:complete len:332 (-) Transcript_12120:1382-2377(-)